MSTQTGPLDLFTAVEPDVNDWFDQAGALIGRIGRRGATFTADTLRDAGLPEPPHTSQWGALFKTLCNRRLIAPVGYTRSARRGRNGSLVRVWAAKTRHN
jgi:hypothetical protein